MSRSMRRARLALDERECEEILKRGEYGVLAVQGDEGYPYTVPLNYVFVDGAIYFHSAKEGHKIDAITREAKASFCVVDKSAVVPELFRDRLQERHRLWQGSHRRRAGGAQPRADRAG